MITIPGFYPIASYRVSLTLQRISFGGVERNFPVSSRGVGLGRRNESLPTFYLNPRGECSWLVGNLRAYTKKSWTPRRWHHTLTRDPVLSSYVIDRHVLRRLEGSLFLQLLLWGFFAADRSDFSDSQIRHANYNGTFQTWLRNRFFWRLRVQDSLSANDVTSASCYFRWRWRFPREGRRQSSRARSKLDSLAFPGKYVCEDLDTARDLKWSLVVCFTFCAPRVDFTGTTRITRIYQYGLTRRRFPLELFAMAKKSCCYVARSGWFIFKSGDRSESAYDISFCIHSSVGKKTFEVLKCV